MNNYIYDGVLSPNVINGIKSMIESQKCHCVEINGIPKGFTEFSQDVMRDVSSIGEDCMGSIYTKTHKCWGFVAKNFGTLDRSGFIFFKFEDEKKKFIDAFKDHVLNENPFKTMIM